MKERPILFSGEMVRAILAGQKSVTRRVVKFPRYAYSENCAVKTWDEEAAWWNEQVPDMPDTAVMMLGERFTGQYLLCNLKGDDGIERVRCPYGQVGDRLWVKEGFFDHGDFEDQEETPLEERVEYRATEWERLGASSHDDGPWTSSRFMPRKFSRITLEITGVRVERLQEISAEDAFPEGVGNSWQPESNQIATYKKLWDSLNAKRGYSWESNPWVWVIEVIRIGVDE